jgi:hypothetical protein
MNVRLRPSEHSLEYIPVEDELNYDRQSVGQSVLVSGTHLKPATIFSFSLKFSLDSCVFVFCSALSDERTGL